MPKTFLQVDKDLFNIGLSPTEILILAQIEEWMRTTGDCHMTDEQFAQMLSISLSTVKRAITKLCELGMVVRDTKPSSNGKKRNLYSLRSKMNLGGNYQGSIWTLPKEQNEPCPRFKLNQ